MRLTLFNPDGEPVRAQARTQHTGGILVVFGDGSVRAGSFLTFDLKRSDIRLPGEAGTGRLQLQGSLRLTFSGAISKVAVSLEVVDITDGTSNTVFVGELPPSRGGEDIISLPDDIVIGFARDQRVRLTLTNPPPNAREAGSEAQREPVNAHVKFFDENGNLIAQSDELIIPPGEFRSVDLNRAALNLPGEPGTGRVQVRARVIWETLQLRSEFPASVELVDTSTGKTTVLTGQQCLVFFLGGIPE
jgi:hypothetical protein